MVAVRVISLDMTVSGENLLGPQARTHERGAFFGRVYST
jgi:hypothetical protein